MFIDYQESCDSEVADLSGREHVMQWHHRGERRKGSQGDERIRKDECPSEISGIV